MPRRQCCRRPGTSAAVPNAPDGLPTAGGLSASEVDRLFDHLTPEDNIALAVSGGADSLALLVLFAEWRRRNTWPGKARVIVVDHGLRPESAEEATFVQSAAAQQGLNCKVLRWSGDKPRRNLQEEARLARYRLISNYMNEAGASVLLLGHHLDDQAETLLDRLTRGSGVFGLSAMASEERHGPAGLHLKRPLLSVPKQRLEASLRARGLSWCEDPSNLDERYKRVRLRRMAARLEEEGLSADRLAQTATHMRRAREALEAVLLKIYAQCVDESPAGPLRIACRAYRDTPEELRLRLLTLLIARATGRHVRQRLTKLQAVDGLILEEGDRAASLSGARFMSEGDRLYCWREAGRQPPEVLSTAFGPIVWDGRYLLERQTDEASAEAVPLVQVGPLCRAPLSGRDIVWPSGWPKRAFECSPVVWSASDKVLILPESLQIRAQLDEGGAQVCPEQGSDCR